MSTSGQSSQGFVRRENLPMVDREVQAHLARVGDPTLVTVTHTPNAITSHLVFAETSTPPEVRMEQGRVVTKLVTVLFGTIVSVVGGPAVVEIALHQDADQREAYLVAVQKVDAETRQHTLDAVQTFAMPIAMAVVQQLGVVDEQDATEEAPR